MSADEALRRLGARRNGLNPDEIEDRRARFGRNEVAHEKPPAWYVQLAHAFWTPFTLVLMALAVISWISGDVSAAVIIGVMVALATILRFTQEFRSSQAAHALRLMVRTSTLLERQEPTDPDVVDSPLASRRREVPIEELVPGDIVHLAAGDMIPADVRLLTAKDLFVSQSALTGEALPVEKSDVPAADSPVPVTTPTTRCNSMSLVADDHVRRGRSVGTDGRWRVSLRRATRLVPGWPALRRPA